MSCDYLKGFRTELKPVNPEMLYAIEYINSISSSNIFKSNVLEVGLGTGRKSIRLSELFERFYGIEPDPELYKIFTDSCTESNCKITSYNMDFDTFVSETNLKFDLIILENVIHFIELDDFIVKSKQILNPDGYILIKNPKAIPAGWGNKEFCADSDKFDEVKWIRFRTQLKEIYSRLDNSEYLIKKNSTNTSHFFILKI